jgi:hypothetical protein
VPAFQAGQAGSIPAGHSWGVMSDEFGDRLRAGRLALNQETEVRILLPEPYAARSAERKADKWDNVDTSAPRSALRVPRSRRSGAVAVGK